jgi:hypothetical protein
VPCSIARNGTRRFRHFSSPAPHGLQMHVGEFGGYFKRGMSPGTKRHSLDRKEGGFKSELSSKHFRAAWPIHNLSAHKQLTASPKSSIK